MFILARLLTVCLILFSLTVPSAAFATQKKEIVVGAHLPLTGMLAAVGLEQKWAYEEAVYDINRAGGIYLKQYNAKLPVRLVIIDDKTIPGLAAAAVERLTVRDKADVILGGHSAAFGVIPGCVAADRYQIYYHATGCFVPPWQEHYFKYSTLMFFDLNQALALPFKICDSFELSPSAFKIAVLAEDTFDARVLTETSLYKSQEKGYNVVLEKYWQPHNDDFSDIVEALRSSGADSILMFGTNTDCILLIKQIKAANLPLKIIFCWRGAWSYQFWEALGPAAEYVFFDGFWHEEYTYEHAQELGQRFRDEFNDSSVSVGAFYAAAQILFQAIEDAGSLDPQKIRLAVLRGKFDTVLGPIKYNEHGVGLFECAAFQWIDGQKRLVYPFNLATDKPLIMPQP